MRSFSNYKFIDKIGVQPNTPMYDHLVKTLPRPLAILLNVLPKPEACWSGRNKDKCEKLILLTGFRRGLDSNQGSHGCKPSGFPPELSCYPHYMGTMQPQIRYK